MKKYKNDKQNYSHVSRNGVTCNIPYYFNNKKINTNT